MDKNLVKTVALYTADWIKEHMTRYARMSEINYDETTNTLSYLIEFHGWDAREKAISCIEENIELAGVRIGSDLTYLEIYTNYKIGNIQSEKICDVKIKWVNLDRGKEVVPEIMRPFLSCISYENYLKL